MNADDITKLLLAGALAFAIVLISYGIFKILNNLSGTIQDFRKTVRNTSTLSDYVLEDYTSARRGIYSIVDNIVSIKEGILDPLNLLTKIISLVRTIIDNRSKTVDDGE